MSENRKNTGGRPPKPTAEKQAAEVKFHVTPTVKARLQDEAKSTGVDLATYCRAKVLTGQPPRRIPPELLALVSELMREKNNLNQLAKIANADKDIYRIGARLERLIGFYDELSAHIKSYFHDRKDRHR